MLGYIKNQCKVVFSVSLITEMLMETNVVLLIAETNILVTDFHLNNGVCCQMLIRVKLLHR